MGVPPTNPDAVREAFATLARSLKRLGLYRHAKDRQTSFVEPALASFRDLLERTGSVLVEVQASALVCDGAAVYSEPLREWGLCFRLHRDGIRSLTFRRGLSLQELLSFCEVALFDPQGGQGPGREDAVTELWKADLPHVAYTAISGYRMEHGELDAQDVADSVRKVASRARPLLGAFGAASGFGSDTGLDRRTVLIPRERLEALDADRWSDLGRRASLALLRIVGEGFAGRDLDALEESFWRLLDELVDHGEAAALAKTLEGLRRMGGAQAQDFRAAVGLRLADPVRLSKVCALAGQDDAGQSEKVLAAALPAWLLLLPPDAGGVLLDVLFAAPAQAWPALARAAVDRADLELVRFAAALASGAEGPVCTLLDSLASLSPSTRAELSAPALSHASPRVRIEAIAAVGGDPASAVQKLGPLLLDTDASVRLATVRALASSAGVAEGAAALLIAAIQGPGFQMLERDEQALFYRALGGLGSNTGFNFLGQGLSTTTGLFKKKPDETGRLFAVTGLLEETSVRALRALEEAADPLQGQPPSVAAAARAAVVRLRNPQARGATR